MGIEVHCTARFGEQSSKGKALLETSELLFRGDFRLNIPFARVKSVKAVDGELRVSTKEGLAVFHLGAAAAKWQEKILHPKSRIEKLGVKPGAKVSLMGEFEAEFLREVRALSNAVKVENVSADADCIFFAAESTKDLSAGLRKIAKGMRGATTLWIVYPKGQKSITENDVLSAGRKSGLKDVKVVGFSPTHTALKFVIPLADR
jgi:hypothetical protein